jgi:hypothetical protein
MEVAIVPQNSLAKNFEEWYTTADELYSSGLPVDVQGISDSGIHSILFNLQIVVHLFLKL